MLRHVSWCRHPANSFINDLRVWYSPRKKKRKTCSCPSEFHWHGALYRADWTSEWREREREFRLVLNSTVVPSGYSRGHTSPTVTSISLTWCCNIYHSIPSSMLCKIHLFQYLSPILGLWHVKHFSEGSWLSPFPYKSSCVNFQQHMPV